MSKPAAEPTSIGMCPPVGDDTHNTPKIQAHKSGWDCTNWDLDTQQPHGGQEWNTIPNFLEDFSVTTNFLGPPRKALAACAGALQHIEHYPAANFEPAHSELAAWIQPHDPADVSARMMLGNGASELIDLVTRIGAHPGDFTVRSEAQYKEYERAALADGRTMVAPTSENNFGIMALVNPCNPTGEYFTVERMKKYIEDTCSNNTTVLVDESMQLWLGPGWREDSLVSQREWVRNLFETRDVSVYIIHSWTKIWSCPGLRLGSVVAPTPEHIAALKKHQVPWSLNVFALEFLSSAVKDDEFLQQTWQIVPRLRAQTSEQLVKMFPSWEVHGEAWLSWLWVDTKDTGVATEAVRLCKAAGVPIRNGGMGYNLPTFIRIKVASSEKTDVLLRALEPLVGR